MKSGKILKILTQIINIGFVIAMFIIDQTTSVEVFFSYCITAVVIFDGGLQIVRIVSKKEWFISLFTKFITKNALIIAIIFTVLGSAPSVIQYINYGYTYHLHHIINNSLTIPLIIYFYINYFKNIENRYSFFDKLSKNIKKHEWISSLMVLYINFSVYYLLFFTLSNWEDGEIYVIAKIWNCVFLMNSLFLYLTFITFTFVIIKELDEKIDSAELFPSKAQGCMDVFYVVWLTMVFWGGRIEMYYQFCVIGNLSLIWLQILLCIKRKMYDKIRMKKLCIHNVFISIATIIYLIIINYFNSKIYQQQEVYSILLTFAYIFLVTLIILGVILYKGEK